MSARPLRREPCTACGREVGVYENGRFAVHRPNHSYVLDGRTIAYVGTGRCYGSGDGTAPAARPAPLPPPVVGTPSAGCPACDAPVAVVDGRIAPHSEQVFGAHGFVDGYVRCSASGHSAKTLEISSEK